MKIRMNIKSAAIFLLLALAFGSLSAAEAGNKGRAADAGKTGRAAEAARSGKAAEQELIVLRGRVIDAETKSPLVFASVAVTESNVGIITNIDGGFTLKISPDLVSHNIEVTFLGYKNKIVPVSSLRDDGFKNTIALETAPIPIKEVIVRPLDPEAIVERAISRLGKNYESVPNLMTAFYRETIRKNRTYVSIGEAVMEIFKAPYNNDLRFDGARIYKGRKSTDVEKMDTVLFKLQGGTTSVLQLDIAKNTEAILTTEAMKYYDYSITGVIEVDDRPHYVIGFIQKPWVDQPLFMGNLFIDMETNAITEAEFGFNLSDIAAATAIFIRKKPFGMEVTPELATYRTKYREQDGKWYFSYSRAEVRFKVRWKRKLFSTFYTTMSEIAVTDRTDQEVIKFAGKEKVRYTDIFSEKVSAFTDPDFWGDYNVIEPDQSIEAAIRKLSRRLKFSDRQDLEE
ncbi:MAG TPA: carboxypeptidase-like regulatory domain-containing protein [Bacteroidales bacterium]|nr:carboxypeptidase-like regulatory domain-containing protein [Bacteroidales bacterium]